MRRSLSSLVILLVSLAVLAPAIPAAAVTTFFVNSTADDVDGGGCQVAPDDCTLREAITAANASPGLDKVNFALGSGVPTISIGSQLPDITDRIYISGNTGGATRVELTGPPGPDFAEGLLLLGAASSGSLIRRLVMNDFGGSVLAIIDSSENHVRDNWIGTDETGLASGGGGQIGVLIQNGNDNTVGSESVSGRNVISGHETGVFILGESSSDVLGNFIGTDRTGTAALPNTADGILVVGSDTNRMVLNVIAGNGGNGVELGSGTIGNAVSVNRIGVDLNLAPLGNGGDGVTVVADSSSANQIDRNWIDNNGGLGIDLGDDGVTLNDNADNDTGPHGLLNFPVITRADSNASGTLIKGRIRVSPAGGGFGVDLFASPACDPSGFGEGHEQLTGFSVVTDSEGRETFEMTVSPPLPVGWVVTATTFSFDTGSTSEFSACRTVI